MKPICLENHLFLQWYIRSAVQFTHVDTCYDVKIVDFDCFIAISLGSRMTVSNSVLWVPDIAFARLKDCAFPVTEDV